MPVACVLKQPILVTDTENLEKKEPMERVAKILADDSLYTAPFPTLIHCNPPTTHIPPRCQISPPCQTIGGTTDTTLCGYTHPAHASHPMLCRSGILAYFGRAGKQSGVSMAWQRTWDELGADGEVCDWGGMGEGCKRLAWRIHRGVSAECGVKARAPIVSWLGRVGVLKNCLRDRRVGFCAFKSTLR